MLWCRSFVVLIACIAVLNAAHAQRLTPLPHPIGQPRNPLQTAAASSTGPWTPLTHQPTFLVNGASNPILLTDGTVLIQDTAFPDWWKLTPDKHGSYVNGTWTQIASLPATYSPLYHSTAVLRDGRMIIEGGEYLLSLDRTKLIPTWTNQGAIYNPLTNHWTPVAPPAGWDRIGDAQSVVLANGTYMQANCCTTETALLDADDLTWTPTGSNKFDINDEEGWTLLPNDKVLAVDAYVFIYNDLDGTNSERYNPETKAWSSAGSTIVQLWDSAASCGGKGSNELGPAVLRPNGTVFYTGANSCGAGNTSIYNTHTHTWSPGPHFPGSYNIADGPAALEPNGKVLMMASPGIFLTPSKFFEWNGSSLYAVANPPNAPFDSSYFGNMLVLPTGQIFFTDFSNDVEIYTPGPGGDRDDWAPVVTDIDPESDHVLSRGHSYEISGYRFNGMSQGAAYGDDVQAATNYPLVRITNLATGHVRYSRTHHHSSMAVASDDKVSTHFEVPADQETGASVLEVVANGIPSHPVHILVR